MTGETETSMEAAAEALSHDIRGSIGTIGLKLSRMINAVKSESSSNDSQEKKSNITSWSNQISALYDEAAKITNSVRTAEIEASDDLRSIIRERLITPFGHIISSMDRMAAGADSSKSLQILKEARRATGRVHKLLSGINAELAEGAKYSFVRTNLKTHLENATAQLEDKLQHLNKAPNISGSSSIFADQNAVLAVFMNIIDNSVTHGGKGSNLEIIADVKAVSLDEAKILSEGAFEKLTAPSQWACVEISDNGIGIDDAEKERVLDMGYQISTEHSENDGSGFGLFRVLSHMKGHRGRVILLDRKPEGLLVRLLFPQNPASVRTDRQTS